MLLHIQTSYSLTSLKGVIKGDARSLGNQIEKEMANEMDTFFFQGSRFSSTGALVTPTHKISTLRYSSHMTVLGPLLL